MSKILIAKKVKDGFAVEIIKSQKLDSAEGVMIFIQMNGLKYNKKLSNKNKLVATE
jgi:hypothetical protein